MASERAKRREASRLPRQDGGECSTEARQRASEQQTAIIQWRQATFQKGKPPHADDAQTYSVKPKREAKRNDGLQPGDLRSVSMKEFLGTLLCGGNVAPALAVMAESFLVVLPVD